MAAAPDDVGGSWLPLESSPDVLNPFVHRLGLEALQQVIQLTLDAHELIDQPLQRIV